MKFSWLAAFLILPSAAMAFEGRYSNAESDWRQSAAITENADGTYSVSLEVTTPRCVGGLEAVGRLAGEVLVVDESNDGFTCSVAIRRTAIGINVKEFTCDMHGARCGFEGYYTRLGAASAKGKPAAPTAPDDDTAFLLRGTPAPPRPIAGRFTCAGEINIEPAKREDPNYRLKPIEPGMTLSVGYDHYYANSAITFSSGGDSTTYRGVRVSIVGDTAVYKGSRGARWEVRPVGGRTVTIRGTGVPDGTTGFACSWR
ncbi:MAG: hypothetical protein OEL76_07510 [Siculibacillus sp.]|nr:hypothetical protein [Siculibacillus sp.]